MFDVLKSIIDIEWDMFSNTQNIGGQADCQQNYEQFTVMRTSQLQNWSDEALSSYLNDLRLAHDRGINLMSLKYAYMMESTSPGEFKEIRDNLPAITEEVRSVVDRLVALTVIWADEFHLKYPKIGAISRPVHKESDSMYVTSAETYQRGEMYTYSIDTLSILLRDYETLDFNGRNLYTEILEDTVKQLGYTSLEQAEKSI